MPKLISIMLLLCMGWQITGRLHAIWLFNLNQDTIAKTLCENKNRPSKKCHGKCVLVKHLKNEAEQEQKQNSSLKDQNELMWLGEKGPSPVILFSSPFIYIRYMEQISGGISAALFHPPAVG